MIDKGLHILGSYKETLLGDDISIYHRTQNIYLFIAALGSLTGIVQSFFFYDDVMSIASRMVCAVINCILLYISTIFRKSDRSLILTVTVTNTIVIPIMYFCNGGYKSGIIAWLIFGLLFPWFLLKGKQLLISEAVSIVSAMCCILLQYFFPQLVRHPHAERVVYEHSFQPMFAVLFIVVCIFKYLVHIYERQSVQMAQKDSDLRLTVEELKREAEAKGAFLAQMSHEIRTPINAVLGMDEMILRESDDKIVTEYARNIRSAGQSLLSIVNDILDFSKMNSGKLVIVPVNYDINDVIGYCRSIIDIRAREKKLDFRIIKAEGLPDILYGDEIRIRQILVNLLSNAVKYTSKGYVEMRLNFRPIDNEKDMIMLICEVQDTGMGIDKENQSKLFNSFIRVDERENRNIEGTGLGLAITKQLTELMNGTVGVTSEKGIGSVFTFSVPQKTVAYRNSCLLSEHKEKSSAAAGKHLYAPAARILVVDDVKMNIDVFKGLLKNTEVSIDAAYSGTEALGLLKSNSYDAVFMDHLMPGMDGVETLRRFREQPDSEGRNGDTPFIALTANAMAGAEEEYRSYGFTDYLSKPVKGNDIEKMLFAYLPSHLISERKDQDLKPHSMDDIGRIPHAKVELEAGLGFCGGDTELYRRISELYSTSNNIDKLRTTYADKDIESYISCLYRTAGNSENIGARPVAEAARRIAEAAARGDSEYVEKNHSRFIRLYEATVEEVREMLRK